MLEQAAEAFRRAWLPDEARSPWADERARCAASPAYFLDTYAHIYDSETERWQPFRLWPEQRRVLDVIDRERQVVVLKARQLGLSWLSLGYVLWRALFHPAATANIFSLRENEAVYLLGPERLKGMYERLPEPLRPALAVDSARHLGFANGSNVRAFPTSAGDSYAGTLALVDEADLVPDLGKLLRRVRPSVAKGGKLLLVSRANKDLPVSEFKRIYLGAREGKTSWRPFFLPWHARPDRTPDWYKDECRDALANTGALDDVHEQYPATDTEALAPPTLSKRIPAPWLEACYTEGEGLDLATLAGAPALPDLTVYAPPVAGRRYVVGADPAEGLPGGDDSAATVMDRDSGEEAARLAGKFEPKRAFPGALAQVAKWYNRADVLCERNNHGHAVIAALESARVSVLVGRDHRAGWPQSTLGKVEMYDAAADQFKNGEVRVRSFSTYMQLASIDRTALAAPPPLHDDEAVSFALASLARVLERPSGRLRDL